MIKNHTIKYQLLTFLCLSALTSGLMAETFILNSSATNFDTKEPLERDNTKKVVYDPNTNLMWQDDKILVAYDEQYNLTKEAKKYAKNWQDAIKQCENLKFAGFDNWRLPTIIELKSIVDYNKSEPAIIDGFKNVGTSHYWSSSPNVSYSNDAWYVHFNDGSDGTHGKSYDFLVRCVRDSN